MAKIGLVLGRPQYVEEGPFQSPLPPIDGPTSSLTFARLVRYNAAKYQFLLHIQYLMDTTTGLWFHGWQFEGTGGHNFARALWARGNCWVGVDISRGLPTERQRLLTSF
jgi:unsaturated rhamnogalacturonyl hydrolase